MRYAPKTPYGPAVALTVLLAMCCAAVTGLALFERDTGEAISRSTATTGEATGFAVLVLVLVISAAASVTAFLVWFWQARTNADINGTRRRRVSRGWSLAFWLIPVVNLIAPPMAVHDVWRRSGAGPERRWLVLLAAWWAAWLLLLAIAFIRPVFSDGSGLTGVGLLEAAATVTASALCIAVVWWITRLQGHGLRGKLSGKQHFMTFKS